MTTNLEKRDERDELVNHSLDKLRELGQVWRDRLTFDNLRLAERYVKGDLDLCVVFQRIGTRDTGEYVAVLKKDGFPRIGKKCGIGRDFPVNFTDLVPEFQHLSDPGIGNPIEEAAGPGRRDDQQLVLVEIIKLAQRPEAIVPTVVRLCRLDEWYNRSRDILYFSLRSARIIRCGSEDGPRGISSGDAMISFNQSARQVVEGGSKVVNTIAGNERNGIGDRSAESNPMNFISSLRVVLDDRSISIVLVEGQRLDFQLMDVMFGPFNLRPNSE